MVVAGVAAAALVDQQNAELAVVPLGMIHAQRITFDAAVPLTATKALWICDLQHWLCCHC